MAVSTSTHRPSLTRRARLALAGIVLAIGIVTTVCVPAFAASPDLKPGPIGPIGGFDDILNPLPPEPLPPVPPTPTPTPDPPFPPRPGINLPEEVLEVDPGGDDGPVDPPDHIVFMPMIAN